MAAFKRSFFDGDWLISVVFVFVLSFIQQFITFRHRASVNAQPLSPPIYEKITPHKKIIVSHFGVLRLRCFCSCHTCVDLLVPLATPLGQIGLILIDFDATVVRLLIWNTLFEPIFANNISSIYK